MPPVIRICECIKLPFGLPKRAEKWLVKDYLPLTRPSLIWRRPKHDHSSHMLKQQGPQISVQRKNQKAKLHVYSLLLLLLTDSSFCPRPPPSLTPWLHPLTARRSLPCIPQDTPNACLWLLSQLQNHPMPTASCTALSSQNPSIFLTVLLPSRLKPHLQYQPLLTIQMSSSVTSQIPLRAWILKSNQNLLLSSSFFPQPLISNNRLSPSHIHYPIAVSFCCLLF